MEKKSHVIKRLVWTIMRKHTSKKCQNSGRDFINIISKPGSEILGHHRGNLRLFETVLINLAFILTFLKNNCYLFARTNYINLMDDT